jgi:hypothetical protein
VDKNLASQLVDVLESSGVRVDSPSLTPEDISDIRVARKARKQESITWEDAKAQLGV